MDTFPVCIKPVTLLALDTSTTACSVALSIGSDVRTRYVVAPREHAQRLLLMVDSLLSEAGLELSDLDAVAFGKGPGSFTGIRIAAGVAQGLAFGKSLPVIPISSLAALAYGQYDTEPCYVVSVLDARMQQIYWGAYHCSEKGVRDLSTECVADPESLCGNLPDEISEWVAVGNGEEVYQDLLFERCSSKVTIKSGFLPHARDVVRLAYYEYLMDNSVLAEEALPVYLRDKVVHHIKGG